MALYRSPEYQTSFAFQFRRSSSKYIFIMKTVLAILGLLPTKFKSFGLLLQKKKVKIHLQDASHLGFLSKQS